MIASRIQRGIKCGVLTRSGSYESASYEHARVRRRVEIVLRAIGSLVLLLLASSGCSTLTLSSSRSAAEVSACIAEGWRHVPSSGLEVPVSLSRRPDSYYVEAVMVRDFPTFIPLRSVWANVVDSPTGSSTTYRRNLQITHAKLDAVVSKCQELDK
jgi:hypothetical protein